jgi:hypothetical protein
MKSMAFIAFAIFSILLISTVSASTADLCEVDKLDIETIATETTTTAKMTYFFECDAAAYAGQMNKMVVTVPYPDIYNVEAEDGLGVMKVFEGPSYASATSSDIDSTVGSFFRKAVVFEPSNTTGYKLILKFQSERLVTSNQKVYTVNPNGLGSNPKVTIVTTGVTETVLPVNEIDYKLTLPPGSAIVSSPNGCGLSDGTVSCIDITSVELDAIEVKWTGTGPSIWLTKIRDVSQKLPGTFTDMFKNLFKVFKK